MIKEIGARRGEWCDVDWSPSEKAFIFASLEQPSRLVVVGTTYSEWTRGTFLDLGRWGLYLRAAADGAGNVCCVLQDGRDRNPATGQFYPAIVVLFPKDGPPREIPCPAGPAFGQNAVEVLHYEEYPDGWVVYVVTSPSTYWMGYLGAGGVWRGQETGAWPQTSQGFADGPERMDDVRASVPGMVCPSTVGGISIGQAGEPDRIRGLHNGVYFTALPGPGFEPHLVSDGQGHWMGCARTPQGAALFTLAPPFEAEQAPPKPADDAFDVVPAGTLVQDAIACLIGTSPNQQGEIVCLPKNTHPEAEWRRVTAFGELLHWADASRFPGDPGWWIDPAPVWAMDTFRSGVAVSTEHAQIVDLRPGVTPNRWRQTNTLYGLKGGGVLVQFDPRFSGQYTDMSKQGTAAWAPAGYEKQWVLRDGRAKWQYIVTPLTAKGRIPWGDPSMDVVIQEAENGPTPPGPRPPQPFIPCPRPLASTPQPKPEPKMPSATAAQIAEFVAQLNDPILLGARQRYRDEVLLPRDRVSAATDGDGQPGNHTDMMTGGAAMFFDRSYVRDYLIARIKGADVMGASVAGLIGAADAYRRAVGIVTPTQPGTPRPAFSGPIATSGRDFVTP